MVFIGIDDLEAVEPFPGYVGRFLHSETMSVANWKIGAGSPFPEHSHHHEQIMIISEGEFELTLEGEVQIMRPGVVALIPSNARHSGHAITDCTVIDIFHPVREDYK